MNNNKDQNYISNTLYHFVGRGNKSDDDIFEILNKILSTQEMLFDPDKKYPDAVKMLDKSTINKLGEISRIPAICFCDIPANNLGIHMNKYSQFGIGFKKQNLCNKGVRPVWYIPIDASSTIVTSEKVGSRFPKDLYNILNSTSTIITKLTEHTNITDNKNQLTEDADLQNALNLLHSGHFFILAELAWFFKFYDSRLPDTDEKNYYFEREWRKVNGNLSFNHEDIECIVVPSNKYKEKLLKNFAQYRIEIQQATQ